MSILKRFLTHRFKPSTSRRKIREKPGPMTAHEARSLIWPIVIDLDPGARLIFITSGLDINHKGQSFFWEYLFLLPNMQARSTMSLSPLEDADIENGPIYLIQHLNPVSDRELKTITLLPERFRDSPEVLAEFSAEAGDFDAGNSDMKMESRVLSTGETVWVTFYRNEERITAFGLQST